MTLTRQAHVGYHMTCDAIGCTATTVLHSTRQARRTPVAAALAALQLGWVETLLAGESRWVCPTHQTFDPRLERWVAIPLITERRRRRVRHAS